MSQTVTVTLVQRYDPAWQSWFETLRREVEPKLGGIPHTVEHVGSTAIPGMTAKPIIDLDIVIEPGAFGAVNERLGALGYFHQGDLGIPGREAFELEDPEIKAGLPSHDLYVCERGTRELRKHLAFRDFLRAHPDWVEKLSDLKWFLCQQHDNDRQAYMDGKSAMVVEITAMALGGCEQGG